MVFLGCFPAYALFSRTYREAYLTSGWEVLLLMVFGLGLSWWVILVFADEMIGSRVTKHQLIVGRTNVVSQSMPKVLPGWLRGLPSKYPSWPLAVCQLATFHLIEGDWDGEWEEVSHTSEMVDVVSLSLEGRSEDPAYSWEIGESEEGSMFPWLIPFLTYRIAKAKGENPPPPEFS